MENREKMKKGSEIKDGKRKRGFRCRMPAALFLLFALWGVYIGLGFGLFPPWKQNPFKASAACRTERDLSFQTVSMEEFQTLEEREKDGSTGLMSVAAWRTGEAGRVRDVVSGKSAEAGVICVYGPMALAFPSRVLSGSLEQNMGPKDCVLTKGLSWELFGSVDTEGCELTFGDHTYRVAAVIDRKEQVLFLAAREGAAERAAFAFRSPERLEEKMEALGFGAD